MAKMLLGISVSRITLMIIMIIGPYYSNSAFGNLVRQTHKVTISATNIPLGNVFNVISKQTGLVIINNYKMTKLNEDKNVTVNFVKTEINKVMTFLLSDNHGLSFKLDKKSIVIYDTEASPSIIPANSLIKNKDTLSTNFHITGKITDNSGNPIPGATVKIKNSTHGTISNIDGTFRLSNIDKGDIITVSSIGFETKEIVARDKNMLVQLNSHTNILDEKVIMAYGSTTKRLNTGNISSIKAIDIEKQPVNNPILSLQGRIPGLYIQQSNGLSGTGVTVRIQGSNSLNSGNDPFYVVDGIPFVSQLLPTNNSIGGTSGVPNVYGNPLSYLNSADIESIEILKDADATAIYGSRAANGAVLITTKRGKSGETRVNIRLQSGWAKVPRKLDVLNSGDYLSMRHEALKNDGITDLSPYDWDLNGTWDTTRNIDWQKELIGGTAQYTDAQFDISGGNSLTQFMLGAGYHKETTVFPGDFSDIKGSLHFSINNSSSNQKLKMQLTGNFMYDNNKLPRADLTSPALTLAPVAPDPYNADGTINWAPDANGSTTYYFNPMAPLAQNSTNKTTNLLSNATLSYEIIQGLIIKGIFGYTSLLTNEISKNPFSTSPPEVAIRGNISSLFLTNRINSWLVEPQLEYKRNILKGNLTVLLGSTIQQQNSDQESIVASGFNNDLVMEDLTAALKISGSTINSVYKYNAIYSRMTYNWKDKYIINFNARRDGSSRFGTENQFHNFGSAALAWIFSQEQFIQNIIPFLSFGKLRSSFGTTGNDQIGDYKFLDVYRSILITGNPYQSALGIAPTRLTNPYLQWEETKKFQVGLDLGFIDDGILLMLNYNLNRSANQLSAFTLPSVTGFGGITRNFPAVVQNSGWELTLTTSNIKKKNFSWSTSFNLTIPKNQLLSYFGLDKNNSILIGNPISILQYFDYAGVNDTTGAYQFKDKKGNLTSTPSDPIDRTVIVSPDPKFYGGLQNTFTYKGFSLDLFIQFAKKSTIDNITYGFDYYYPGTFNYGFGNQLTAVMNRWQKPGDKATHQPYSSDYSKDLGLISNSTAIWSDASFIKLKNIALSWQIPDRWKKKMRVQNFRLFFNAQNIFTLTRYNGLDPETPGLGLPPLRTMTIGAQIGL